MQATQASQICDYQYLPWRRGERFRCISNPRQHGWECRLPEDFQLHQYLHGPISIRHGRVRKYDNLSISTTSPVNILFEPGSLEDVEDWAQHDFPTYFAALSTFPISEQVDTSTRHSTESASTGLSLTGPTGSDLIEPAGAQPDTKKMSCRSQFGGAWSDARHPSMRYLVIETCRLVSLLDDLRMELRRLVTGKFWIPSMQASRLPL